MKGYSYKSEGGCYSQTARIDTCKCEHAAMKRGKINRDDIDETIDEMTDTFTDRRYLYV